MMRARVKLLLGVSLVAAVGMATASVSLPGAVRVVLGVPLVFLLPGFALTSATNPDRHLSPAEELLAGVGTSLAIATGGAVLLAAIPIGLSRGSIAALLGAITIALSAIAWLRSRPTVSIGDPLEKVGQVNRP